MKFCTKCGNQLEDDMMFCQKCGTKSQISDLEAELNTLEDEKSQQKQYQYNNQDNTLLFTYNGININLEELIKKYGPQRKANAINELSKRTKMSYFISKKVIDEAYNGKLFIPSKKEIEKANNKGCLTVLLWILLFPIMLIITIVKSNKISKGLKIVLIISLSIIFIAIAISSPEESSTSSNQTSSIEPSKSTINLSTDPKIDSNIKLIIDKIGLTNSEAEKVFDDLKSVGFTSISSIDVGVGTGIDDLQSYIVVCDGINAILTIEKRITYYIGSGSVDLYNNTKGGVLNQITDYTLTSIESTSFMMKAEDYVKKGLKSPSTAKFPGKIFEANEWSVGRKKDLVQVKSYVDSQNGFGAMIRSEFVVQMDYSSGDPIYMAIGGETVYGTPYKEK